MNNDDINTYIPSILNPRSIKKENVDLNFTQHSVVSRCSLSLKKRKHDWKCRRPFNEVFPKEKPNNINNKCSLMKPDKHLIKISEHDVDETLGFSAVEDLNSVKNDLQLQSDDDLQLCDASAPCDSKMENTAIDNESGRTVIYNFVEAPVVSVSFSLKDCKNIDVSAKNSNIKDFSVFHDNNNTNVHCKIIEDSCLSSDKEVDDTDCDIMPSPRKKQAVAVNLEIKRKKCMSADNIEDDILILKTNAIEKISHVIVQPPNYKLVKRKVPFREKLKPYSERFSGLDLNNGKVSICGEKLKQKSILNYFCNNPVLHGNKSKNNCDKIVHEINKHNDEPVIHEDEDMNKNPGVTDLLIKSDKIRPNSLRVLRENDHLHSNSRLYSPKKDFAYRQQDIKASSSEVPRNPSPRLRNGSVSSYSPRKNAESLHFSLPSKSKSNKTNITQRGIPFYKIVAGTHFAVDAFSYGDIPNVNHYFLTHFHSDHYAGLKKGFNKLLFCSQITAELCTSRLGVNSKCIQILNLDETIKVDGIEVTAVDANHCPGAVMLIFSLPNGKNLLHTGDFRASPYMESYPVFWNKDIHTVYLDTTYCNPCYDFPTQDQSLEMALHLLRQKKASLEEAGKKFASVLIVCGTYTIGKERFFSGVARRVGCAVWACPEKERVLRAVEGRQGARPARHACQLHVVPMRDLTHEKLRAYLDSLQGAFSEVVAFKPSGWESGKETAIQRDLVTIHGIPYSEHSSFPEMIRFVNFLKPKQIVPTVSISGGVKTVQKYFPCPLVYKEDLRSQSRVTDYFSAHSRQQVHAVS